MKHTPRSLEYYLIISNRQNGIFNGSVKYDGQIAWFI